MIDDELLRRKLLVFLGNLRNVNENISSTNYEYVRMVSSMNECLLVDSKIIEEDKIKSNQKALEDINREISNGVIPRVNNLL